MALRVDAPPRRVSTTVVSSGAGEKLMVRKGRRSDTVASNCGASSFLETAQFFFTEPEVVSHLVQQRGADLPAHVRLAS